MDGWWIDYKIEFKIERQQFVSNGGMIIIRGSDKEDVVDDEVDD
jgi:hypothetical protein